VAAKFANIDEYIRLFPDDVQAVLDEVRRTIHSAVPSPGETISYQMPTITLDGHSLVYFAAWKHHIGIYPPIPEIDPELDQELSPYRAAKGTLKFPLREPIPYDLIGRVVALLVSERVKAED